MREKTWNYDFNKNFQRRKHYFVWTDHFFSLLFSWHNSLVRSKIVKFFVFWTISRVLISCKEGQSCQMCTLLSENERIIYVLHKFCKKLSFKRKECFFHNCMTSLMIKLKRIPFTFYFSSIYFWLFFFPKKTIYYCQQFISATCPPATH